MTQTGILQSETATDTLAAIAQNMCNHLLAFQNTIEARPPQERYPTQPELNMLCKMMSCLEKIKRMQKAVAPTRILTNFLAFVRQANNEVAPTVASLLSSFAAEKNLPDAPDKAGQQLPKTSKSTEDTPAPQQAASMIFPQPDPALLAGSPAPPISLADYTTHQNVLLQLNASPTETTELNGRKYNTNWLQYNLYQWCLPPEKRKFHYNEQRYARDIDHSGIRKEIGRYLEKHGV